MRDRASTTAQITSASRVLHGLDPLFTQAFCGRPVRAGLAVLRWAKRLGVPVHHADFGMARAIVARHRFFDRCLIDAHEQGVRQFVLLGAGFDARPWRLAEHFETAQLYLVDHPLTAARRERKARAMPPAPGRSVTVDFATEDFGERLIHAGFDPDAPAFFSWEGVSMYLPEAAVRTTLARLASLSAPGSAVVFDTLPRSTRGLPIWVRAAWPLGTFGLALMGERVDFCIDDDALDAFVEPLGLRRSESHTTGTLDPKAFGALRVNRLEAIG